MKEEKFNKEDITYFFRAPLSESGFIAEKEKNVENIYRKLLKFQNINDWKKYRACIDLIDDTEYAIMNAFRFQLGNYKNKYDIGEEYLRLYGILNAVYQQTNAFFTLGKLLNYPNNKELKVKFAKLDIRKLRNMAGAHADDYTVDYEMKAQNPEINSKTSFRLIATTVSKSGHGLYVQDENNIRFTFNLMEVLNEYEILARETLINLARHCIESLIIGKENKKEYHEMLQYRIDNLINYDTLDDNRRFAKKERKRFEKLVDKIDKKSKISEEQMMKILNDEIPALPRICQSS